MDLINPNKLSVYYCALSTFFNCSKNAFSEKKEPIFLNVLLQSLQARVMIVLDKNNSTMKDRKVGLYLFDHVIKIITKSAEECEKL